MRLACEKCGLEFIVHDDDPNPRFCDPCIQHADDEREDMLLAEEERAS